MSYETHEASHVSSQLALSMARMTDSPTLPGMISSALRGTWQYAQKESEARIKELEAEVLHWKNNHTTEVERARMLKERLDMPVERVRAYESFKRVQELCIKLTAENKELESSIAQRALQQPFAYYHVPSKGLFFYSDADRPNCIENPQNYTLLYKDTDNTIVTWLANFLEKRQLDSYSCGVLVKELRKLLNANLSVASA